MRTHCRFKFENLENLFNLENLGSEICEFIFHFF